MLNNHTELLCYLATKFDFKSYLEIGVQNKANNFDKIPCVDKIGVDPDPNAKATNICTSDHYFKIRETIKEKFASKEHSSGFDLIFIDGLHHADQVRKDFENSLKHLSDGGIIVMHDCIPSKIEHTVVPRGGLRGIWTGDVYRFAMCLHEYKGIDYAIMNADNGCAIVWRTEEVVVPGASYLDYKMNSINWTFFENNQALLRLVSADENEILSKIAFCY